jgi:hypothetical protein
LNETLGHGPFLEKRNSPRTTWVYVQTLQEKPRLAEFAGQQSLHTTNPGAVQHIPPLEVIQGRVAF